MEKLKLLDRVWMWIAHRFGAEKQMIPSLHFVNGEDVKLNRPYEWYGRIVKAVRNYKKVVTTYTIHPSKDMSQEAVDLICQHTDQLCIRETEYTTECEWLGDALKKQPGVYVEEEVKNKPCDLCCMQQEGYPCPYCDFKRYWVKIAEYKQNCTDQEAWARMMAKRIQR